MLVVPWLVLSKTAFTGRGLPMEKNQTQESRKLGILRLKQLREVTEAVAETMDVERVRFDRLADSSAKPRVVSSYCLYQTPEPLADRLAGMFPKWGRTLEPSAGLGRLYRAIRKQTNAEVVLVEQSAECCAELYRETEGDENARLIQGDFLAQESLGLFQCVVANPPFADDRKHIFRMMELLAPNGRLLAICASGPRQHAKLKPLASQWIELPEGSFKSEGTNVAAAIFVFDKE